jgi:hypothetical protein
MFIYYMFRPARVIFRNKKILKDKDWFTWPCEELRAQFHGVINKNLGLKFTSKHVVPCGTLHYSRTSLTSWLILWRREFLNWTRIWNSKIHRNVDSSPSPVPVLIQTNPVHALPSNVTSILILSSHLRLLLSSDPLPKIPPSNPPTHPSFLSPNSTRFHAPPDVIY